MLSSYLDDMHFNTGLAAEGGFINELFLRNDRCIVDKAVPTGQGFALDPTASSRFFHGADTYVAKNLDSRRNASHGRGRGNWPVPWRDHQERQQ